jgi:hypothetical protein
MKKPLFLLFVVISLVPLVKCTTDHISPAAEQMSEMRADNMTQNNILMSFYIISDRVILSCQASLPQNHRVFARYALHVICS